MFLAQLKGPGMTTLHGDSASRSGSIADIRRALQEAVSGADVDAIERRLDAIQDELRAKWAAVDAAVAVMTATRRWR